MKMLTLLAAAAISVPALAQVERGAAAGITRAQVQTRVERMFALTDADRDGFVTAAEAEARVAQRRENPGNRGANGGKARGDRFTMLDRDGNGSISRAEFEAPRTGRGSRAERAERRATRMAQRGARGIALNARQFERRDVNRDGRLSLAEAAVRPLARFARIDVNGDGMLTREERRAAREERQNRRQQRRAG